jgi:hypothetical protein
MKKLFFISVTLIISFILNASKNALSWDDGVTHKDLSRYAAESSVLGKSKGDYLKNLGFEKGLNEEIKWNETNIIVEWLAKGAELEDAGGFIPLLQPPSRSVNHFHNPLKSWSQAGLDDIKTGESSLLWAQDGPTQSTFTEGDWSWQKVRQVYYLALISTTDALRQVNFAQTFRGLGHQMHLIQDAAVPEHVRNDAHPEDAFFGKLNINIYFESWVKDRFPTLNDLKTLAPTPLFPVLSFDPSQYTLDSSYNTRNLVPSALFFDTDQYDPNNPSQFFASGVATSLSIGIAEYTNANFASDDTIFTENKPTTDPHYFPYPNKSSTDIQSYINQNKLPETVIGEDNIPDTAFWIAKTGDGENIVHFVRPRYLTNNVYDNVGGGILYYRTFYRDEVCHQDYASLLIPRAVGYSAGLLNYFFRGALEITAPDNYLYSITDGSEAPYIDTYGNYHQVFTYIKAKVRNTTLNEEMQSGIIQAVARYKKRIDYQPDLSTDPPIAESREPEFSYSVSAPITITSLSSTTPEEFTFDFSNSPIPAGITDLYLHVIFKGTLGNEIDTAIAVGMKDINEPMHISVWNATDRFYLDGVLRTADEIRNDPFLLSRVDHDGDGVSDEFIDPYDLTTNLAFTTTTEIPAVYNVIYTPMPPGRYGRTIILTDALSFYIHIHRESTDPVDSLDTYFLFSGVINQETDGIFNNTQVYTFRGIIQHEWSAFARYYPDYTGISTAPWPVPTITDPYPVTTINP